MRNTSFTVSIPHLFSPISAPSAESNSYIVRFNVHGTLQKNNLISWFSVSFVRVPDMAAKKSCLN